MKEKADCFQHFLGQRKMVFLLEKDAFFRSRVVSSLIEPHHFFLLSLATSMIEATAQWGQIVSKKGKIELLHHCDFTRFFEYFNQTTKSRFFVRKFDTAQKNVPNKYPEYKI